MKNIMFAVLFSALFVLTGCMGDNNMDNPMESMMPMENDANNHDKNNDDKTPIGGSPEVTEPANDAMNTSMSEQDAKKIVLEKVPGAAESDIREWKVDHEDNKKVYEGKIMFGKTEYEFEIDAENGKILKWETEQIKN